jgi:hypothetical protein
VRPREVDPLFRKYHSMIKGRKRKKGRKKEKKEWKKKERKEE